MPKVRAQQGDKVRLQFSMDQEGRVEAPEQGTPAGGGLLFYEPAKSINGLGHVHRPASLKISEDLPCGNIFGQVLQRSAFSQ